MNRVNKKAKKTADKTIIKDTKKIKKDTVVLDKTVRTGHPNAAMATSHDMQQVMNTIDQQLSYLQNLKNATSGNKTAQSIITQQKGGLRNLKMIMTRIRKKRSQK
ncbi:MAG: hypothetical protein ACYDAP_05770 [Thermoplasmataceae archaeon]